MEFVRGLDHHVRRAGDQVVGLEKPVKTGFRHEVAGLVSVLAWPGVCPSSPALQAFWRLRFYGSSWFFRNDDETKTLLKSQP
jgi:hypothetical protein